MITDIIRKEVDDSHYYWVEGEFMPSVSRILDVAAPKEYGLINFFKKNTPEEIDEISNNAKGDGSIVHDFCEKLLNGIEVDIRDQTLKEMGGKNLVHIKKAIISFVEWYKAYKPVTIKTEFTIASKKYKYAGTCDYVCMLGDKRIMIDFKTNKSGIYFVNKIQVGGAYKQAYEETTDLKIDECYCLRLGTAHKCGYEFKRVDEEVGVEDFMNIFNTYLRINGGKVEEPPLINVYPDTLKLEGINADSL